VQIQHDGNAGVARPVQGSANPSHLGRVQSCAGHRLESFPGDGQPDQPHALSSEVGVAGGVFIAVVVAVPSRPPTRERGLTVCGAEGAAGKDYPAQEPAGARVRADDLSLRPGLTEGGGTGTAPVYRHRVVARPAGRGPSGHRQSDRVRGPIPEIGDPSPSCGVRATGPADLTDIAVHLIALEPTGEGGETVDRPSLYRVVSADRGRAWLPQPGHQHDGGRADQEDGGRQRAGEQPPPPGWRTGRPVRRRYRPWPDVRRRGHGVLRCGATRDGAGFACLSAGSTARMDTASSWRPNVATVRE
jgi:hypothetical protein